VSRSWEREPETKMKTSLYILTELSDRDFEWLMVSGRRRAIAAGTTLIHEGDPIDALYIVVDGTLIVTAFATGDKELATLSRGEVVGEMSFADSRPPSATVKAMENTTVWTIPRIQLAAKLKQDEGFASRFYHALAILLSDRLRLTISRLGEHKQWQAASTDTIEESTNPAILGSLQLAQIRLEYLLKRLKDV